MPHRGYFAYHHDNPPAPFNPDADPRAAERYRKVTASMEADGFYEGRTREECKAEWARRYDELKAEDDAPALRRP
jgi:hypothetical protein